MKTRNKNYPLRARRARGAQDLEPGLFAFGSGSRSFWLRRKSTLAQLVYKDVKVDFGVQAWVWVGQEFDILQIAQTIYGRITDQTCGITDLDLLSEKLEALLTGKKFLFVLDDVWSEDYLRWNDFMAHFNRCGVHGSRIIVTTGLRRVASITGTLHSGLGLVNKSKS